MYSESGVTHRAGSHSVTKWMDFNTRGANLGENHDLYSRVRIGKTNLIATRVVHDEA